MKRLYALLLFGCLASVACAAFSLQVSTTGVEGDFVDAGGTVMMDPCSTIYIGIRTSTAEDLSLYDLYTGFLNGTPGSWVGNEQVLGAGDDNATYANSYAGLKETSNNVYYDCWYSNASQADNSGVGLLSSFDFTFTGPDDVHVGLFRYFEREYTLLDCFDIVQTPEPISMSLLGLGALALRRRRA